VLDHDHPPVVAWSPDHATVPTEGLRSSHQRVDLRSKKVTWSGDHATTARPCYNRVPIVTCCLAGANLLGHRRRPMAPLSNRTRAFFSGRRLPMRYPLLLALAIGPLAVTSCEAADTKGAGGNPVVVVQTSMGTIKIELAQDKAPVTVKNFLGYVDDKFYDGTIFHRVIPGFMIQGGGFQPGMKEKETKAEIKNESANGLSNARGTIAMARKRDPDSA